MRVWRGSPLRLGGWIRATRVALGLAVALSCVLLASARPAHAADCGLAIAIPDRWDDVTPIAGYAGGSKKAPDWRNDGAWDDESFTDLNANGLFDPGEPYVDGNANARYDAEAYDPLLTGYVADPVPGNIFAPNGDLGLAIALAPAKPHETGLGRYVPYDCGAGVGSTGSVDRAMRDLIALDPTASWDSASNQVVGSGYPDGSPRLILLPIYDPRVMATAVHGGVPITKIVAVFVERMLGRGSALVRLARVPGPGASDASVASVAAPAAVLRAARDSAPTPSQPGPSSWGRLKAIYR